MNKNIDLHCDLTSYLAEPGTSVNGDIRCSLENLHRGNVKLQVMAFYSSTVKGSIAYVRNQVDRYLSLLNDYGVVEFCPDNPQIYKNLSVIAAVENASGLCEEDMPVKNLKQNFEFLNSKVKLMYVGLTHHLENRFGGGNFTDIGLKNDGKYLLEYLSGRKIAIDLSHTSDRLAFDILNFIDQTHLDFPIIASHSNMRAVFNHNRNLPDELVLEIVRRKGLIGLNLVKYFINPENSSEIYNHIDHAIKLGAENHLCFGADFFDDKAHPDQERYPYFFEEFETPDAYHSINRNVELKFSADFQKKMSYQNVLDYFIRQNIN